MEESSDATTEIARFIFLRRWPGITIDEIRCAAIVAVQLSEGIKYSGARDGGRSFLCAATKWPPPISRLVKDAVHQRSVAGRAWPRRP